ncbi:MAG: hypothetical protein M1825_003702 [Sarcosagium campestre]|nr:MAG: hypothetical protein M1825_003702 [Sarcosagium campestre]
MVLANAVIIQAIIFAGVQGYSMRSVVSDRCKQTGRIIWPAIWIPAYVTLVFGVEAFVRIFRKSDFPPRGRYNVRICIGVVLVALFITWLPSLLSPSDARCVANLAWFVAKWRTTAIMIVLSMLALFAVSGIGLYLHLGKVTRIDTEQRPTVVRMLCYIILTTLPLTLTLPFFIQITLNQAAAGSSQLASLAFNTYGILTSILHIFLRFNSHTSSREGSKLTKNKNDCFRVFRSTDLSFGKHITSPVLTTPVTPVTPHHTEHRAVEKPVALASNHQPMRTFEPLRSVSFRDLKPQCPRSRKAKFAQPQRSYSADDGEAMPEFPKSAASAKTLHNRGPSYSVFPSAPSKTAQSHPAPEPPSIQPLAIPTKAARPTEHLASEVSFAAPEAGTPINVPAPLRIRIPEGAWDPIPPIFHQRNYSTSSTATVQIGLRLSSPPGQDPPNLFLPNPLASQPPSVVTPFPGSNKALPPPPRLQQIDAGLTSPPHSPRRANTLAGTHVEKRSGTVRGLRRAWVET